MSEMFFVGSPSTRMRSARRPGVIAPRSSSTRAYRAPFHVATCSTCDGVRPACTYSSSSRCSVKPAMSSVPATSGMPALYMRPVVGDGREFLGQLAILLADEVERGERRIDDDLALREQRDEVLHGLAVE